MSASQWRITALLGLAVALALGSLGAYLWLTTEWWVVGAFWLLVAAVVGGFAGYALLYLKGFFRFQALDRLVVTDTTRRRLLETPPPAPTSSPLGNITQGQLRMDEWQVHLLEVHVTPEVGLGEKRVQLIVDVTNVGEGKSTFTGYTMLLVDAQRRSHGFDLSGSCDCAETHGLEMATLVKPGDTVRTCVAYCVPADADSFTAEPMSIVNIWDGGLAFEAP